MTVRSSTGPNSDELYLRAVNALPGGNSRTTLFVPPHPPYVRRGSGCRIEDVDGHQAIDLQNNYTALIHGHAHPQIVAAANAAIADGASFGLPTEREIAMAEELGSRIGWATHWRFANSGTEAVMVALRAARAVTGRDVVIRFEGCYHGSADAVVAKGAAGIPAGVAQDIVEVPLGDIDAVRRALDERDGEVACVLFDAMPNRAGLQPADPAFVAELREETRRRDVLLVQDEVLTYRIAKAGLHSLYGIEPDLITLGKVIGGGFPVGAIGGPAEIMERFDPRRSDGLPHGGTFSANPVTLAAGLVALELFDDAEIARLNGLGDRLRDALAEQGREVRGRGSLVRLLVDDPAELWWSAYEQGLLLAGNGLACLSTPMDDAVIDEVVERFDRVAR
jgi:glutamate-1-semialdehyde 2,1-aminomutase